MLQRAPWTQRPAEPHLRASQVTLPAPMRGWVQNENTVAASADGAQVIENFFPTTRGVRVRRGARLHATLPAAVVSMFAYVGPTDVRAMFGATATGLYNVTSPADATVAPAAEANITNGYFSAQQITTPGGSFLVCVNGADVMWRYDGTDWTPCNAAAVRRLDYDGGTAAFAVGDVVTGTTSGASATVVAIRGGETAGRLWIGPVTGGPFQDNEAITSAAGAAVANGADAAASSATITGVATDKLSHVWLHKSRLWFVEKNTLKAHYLPVNSIGGALSTLDLGAVFARGGSLLSGDRWSVADSGSGQDDYSVFLSSEGEIAVYSGTNPSDAADWSLVGVYYIGKPLGRRPFMRAGGDLVIATAEGMVPVSVAIQRDPAALSMAAVSRPIEPHWRQAVQSHTAGNWEVVKNTARGFAAVICPTMNPNDSGVLVVNVETGAWARWTWPAVCGCEHANTTWFGTGDGRIAEMESGATDFGASYQLRLAMAPQHLGEIGAYKHVHMARATFIARTPFSARISLGQDYQPAFPAFAGSAIVLPQSLWGAALWGVGVWNGYRTVTTRWMSLNRNCEVATVQVQAAISGSVAPDVELASVDVLYDRGGIVV